MKDFTHPILSYCRVCHASKAQANLTQSLNFSLDPDLLKLLAGSLELRAFVETGTYKGDSVDLASQYFKELHTCELSNALYEAALRRFSGRVDIQCHHGSSPDLLKSISGSLQGVPVLYWLDAHWCAGTDTAGEDSQCPLLEELAAVEPLHERSVVWIDDARFFISPPPKPLEARGWPTFDQVVTALKKLAGDSHRMVLSNDTILLYPNQIEEDVLEYVHENGVDWLHLAQDSIIHLPKARQEMQVNELVHSQALKQLVDRAANAVKVDLLDQLQGLESRMTKKLNKPNVFVRLSRKLRGSSRD